MIHNRTGNLFCSFSNVPRECQQVLAVKRDLMETRPWKVVRGIDNRSYRDHDEFGSLGINGQERGHNLEMDCRDHGEYILHKKRYSFEMR